MNSFVICNTQDEVDAYTSCYGNEYFTIAKEDIGGEYGVFIMMETNNDQ